MISTLEWARSLTFDVADYKLETLADLIDFDIRVSPLHGTLVGAQTVADLVLFLLKRCYSDPAYDAVKGTLIFRAERMNTLLRRSVERNNRRNTLTPSFDFGNRHMAVS